MSSATISKTRNEFSEIVRRIEQGELSEHYVMNRKRCVAKIVPVEPDSDTSMRIGAMRGKWNDFDYETFQALDDEIDELMGA